MVKACETGVSGLQAGLCPARTPVTVEGRSEGSASQTNNVPLDVLSILQHWLVVVTFSVWVTRPPVIFAALITTLQARVSYRVSLFLRSSSKSISFYGSPSLIIVVSLTTVRCDCSAPNTRICTSQRVSDRLSVDRDPTRLRPHPFLPSVTSPLQTEKDQECLQRDILHRSRSCEVYSIDFDPGFK